MDGIGQAAVRGAGEVFPAQGEAEAEAQKCLPVAGMLPAAWQAL